MALLAQGEPTIKADPTKVVPFTCEPLFLIRWAEVTQMCLLLASTAWIYLGGIEIGPPLHVAVDTPQLF